MAANSVDLMVEHLVGQLAARTVGKLVEQWDKRKAVKLVEQSVEWTAVSKVGGLVVQKVGRKDEQWVEHLDNKLVASREANSAEMSAEHLVF
jgi:hypothetical protein